MKAKAFAGDPDVAREMFASYVRGYRHRESIEMSKTMEQVARDLAVMVDTTTRDALEFAAGMVMEYADTRPAGEYRPLRALACKILGEDIGDEPGPPPLCVVCGNPEARHEFRHPFTGPGGER